MQNSSLQISTFVLWNFNPLNELIKDAIWYNEFRIVSLLGITLEEAYMYSLKEVQAMDYLLKRMQYNDLLKQITGENRELKLVIECNNKYISGDFINYQSGSIKQYEFNGPYEYENMTYNNQSIKVFNQLWKSFCDKYLPNNVTSIFKCNQDLSVLLELLFTHIKTVDISNNSIPLRPIIMNIDYFNNELGPIFLYLGEKKIDVVSIVQKEI